MKSDLKTRREEVKEREREWGQKLLSWEGGRSSERTKRQLGSITGGQELLTQVGVREAQFSMAGDPIPVAFLREKGGEGRGFAEFLSSNRRRKFHVVFLQLLELH